MTGSNKKVIEFSESSSSSKKLDISEEIQNKNNNYNNINNIIKNENININVKNSIKNINTNERKPSFKIENSNDFKIIKTYSYHDKNKKIEKDINNAKIEDNNNNSNKIKTKLLKELKTENAININILNKSNNNNLSTNIKDNFTKNIKLENIEKFSFINKTQEGSKKIFKKNNDIIDIKDNIAKTENNITKVDNIINRTDNIIIKTENNIIKTENDIIKTENNIIKKTNNILNNNINVVKPQKEGFQIFSNKAVNTNPRKNSPIIIIKNKQSNNSHKIIDIQNNNKENNTHHNIASLKYNYIAKTTYNQNNNILSPNTRNPPNLNNVEENDQFSSFDKQKNIIKNNNSLGKKFKSAKKKYNQIKLKLNKTNIIKDDKDIYLTKEILKSTRYIKDEDIIDRPLLYDMNIFKFDKNKGNLENRVAELEFFMKKKLDELVKEIKIFIPIHFNSHIRDYSVNKNK